MKMKRGAMIVLEGCDRSGKTSQALNVVNMLNQRNIKAERMSFPDRTTCTGQVISSYLKSEVNLTDQAIHLLFSANRWEAVPKIIEKLNEGVTLIIDRYSYSGVAYSYAKKEAFELDWYKSPEKGLPKPDLVLFLDLEQDVINQRSNFGMERYEKPEFQKLVHKIFLSFEDSNWKVINADMPMNDLTELLVSEIVPTIEKAGVLPISTMW